MLEPVPRLFLEERISVSGMSFARRFRLETREVSTPITFLAPTRTNVREMGSIVKEERRNYSIADFGTLKVTFGNALN